ncbi:MAG TPA: protein kinase, partial [Humisphaera sp.]
MALSPLQDPLLRDVPVVDGYKVLEPAVLVDKLPEGGMAAVYRGLHLDLKVEVAVKVLKKNGDQAYTPQAVARFRQEAEQAARLNDPNLVRIYDFPANRIGLLYLVMEYIDGETVETRVHRKGALGPREAATITLHTARGLHAAHAENVVHRDIKPPNVLLSKRGHVKVADLGIAKAQDSAAMGMTQEITLLGTPQYMAPELWRGARFASPASDVFALGATLAFMLTGRHLLDGADAQEIMHRALTQGFPDLAAIAPGVPPQMVELVRALTASRPQDRPAMDAVLGSLQQLLAGMGGEMPLADPAAGSASAPLSPTRFPSRSDLELIRQRLDQKVQRTAVPPTLGSINDPSTAAAQLATQELERRAGVVPPTRGDGPSSATGSRVFLEPETMPTPPLAYPPSGHAQAGHPPTGQRAAPRSQVPQVMQAPPIGQPPPGRVPTAAPQGYAVPQPPPPTVRPPKKKRRLLKAFVFLLFLLVLTAGAGLFGYQEGWYPKEWVDGRVPPEWLAWLPTVTGRPVASNHPTTTTAPSTTRPATTGTSVGPTTEPDHHSGRPTTVASTTGPADGPPTTHPVVIAADTRPATNPIAATRPATQQGTVVAADTRPTTGPAVVIGPDTRPAGPTTVAVATTKPVDPPPVIPPANPWDAGRTRLADAAKAGQWADVLKVLGEQRRLAETDERRRQYVEDADAALAAFRADFRDLGLRRDANPQLLAAVAPAMNAGSGQAALVAAEIHLDVRGGGRTGPARLVPADPAAGFATAIRYLNAAAKSEHPPTREEARRMRREAAVGQVEFLDRKQDWAGLMDQLGLMPVGEWAASADPAEKASAAVAIPVVDRALSDLLAGVGDAAARRRLLPADAEAKLAVYADAPGGAAALLLA